MMMENVSVSVNAVAVVTVMTAEGHLLPVASKPIRCQSLLVYLER